MLFDPQIRLMQKCGRENTDESLFCIQRDDHTSVTILLVSCEDLQLVLFHIKQSTFWFGAVDG